MQPTPPHTLTLEHLRRLVPHLVEIPARGGRKRSRGGGDSEAVVRHARSAGVCACCGTETGPGIVGFQGEKRYCDVCFIRVDKRLGLLLLAASFLRMSVDPGRWGFAVDRQDTEEALLMFARLYDYLESRYPDQPAHWPPRIASNIEAKLATEAKGGD